MSLRVLIFLELFWLLFCGFWAIIGIIFSGEQPIAGFLRDSSMFLLMFLVVGVGPLVVTISQVRRTFNGKD